MHSKVDKLIEMALSDGKINEKEREIILRKAESLNEDVDEVEMYIEGKISNLENTVVSENIDNKTINCPSCGSPTNSFEARCLHCSHEFKNIKASSISIKIQEELQKIHLEVEDQYRDDLIKTHGNLRNFFEFDLEEKLHAKKISYLNTLPIPNSREDILEFLALSAPLSFNEKKNGVMYVFKHGEHIGFSPLGRAWRAKFEQTIIKAKLSLSDDSEVLALINDYCKEFNI